MESRSRESSDGAVATRREGAPVRDNESWIRSLAEGGPAAEAAQGELRALLVQGLRRVLASRGASADLCEDFAQEALLRIRERLADFRGDSRFTTWALAIATRVAFDEMRHQRWKDVSFEAISEESRAPLSFEPRGEPGQEKGLLRARVLAQLGQVIEEKLTDKQRAVLLAELKGMPQLEIAAALGMNRNALYKLSHDARKSVKLHLEAAGLDAGDVLWVFE